MLWKHSRQTEKSRVNSSLHHFFPRNLFSDLLASSFAVLPTRARIVFPETKIMISLLILSLQVAQCLSRPFKMKAEHPCMAYTIESWQPSSCLLLDWLSPSCGSWMPFAWPCFVLLWCFCSHRRPGLQSASPSPAPHPDPTSLPAVPSGTCRVYHPKDL